MIRFVQKLDVGSQRLYMFCFDCNFLQLSVPQKHPERRLLLDERGRKRVKEHANHEICKPALDLWLLFRFFHFKMPI